MPPSHRGNSVNLMLTLATWEQILMSDTVVMQDFRLPSVQNSEVSTPCVISDAVSSPGPQAEDHSERRCAD